MKYVVWGLVGVVLYFAHAAFVPLALAALLALVLSGPVEFLHRHGVPRSSSATFILLLALAFVTCTVNLMWNPVQGWIANAPRTAAVVKAKVRPIAQFLDRMDQLRRNVSTLTATERRSALPPPPAQAATAAAAKSAPLAVLNATGGVLASLATLVIVTLFLLTGGPPMLARMTAAFFDDLHASHVLDLIEKVRAEVGRFYVTTALINLGLGCATAGAMMAWGMPTPLVWGAMAAVLNFIPYAGSATTLLVIALIAIVSFDSLAQVMGVAGSYFLLSLVEGQVLQPLLVGRRMEVNPLVVFLALWFGGLYWGVAGIILATPTLVALKVIATHAGGSRSLAVFLGPNNQSPDRDRQLKRFTRSLT